MKKLLFLVAILPSLFPGNSANACGNRWKGGNRHHATKCYQMAAVPQRLISSPQWAAVPHQAVAAPPQSEVTAQPAPEQPVASNAVQPSYNYTPIQNGKQAYYYSYDSSGKLIVQKWMDWVFRGGKEAGMPRPPLPVIGWFQ